MPICMTVSSKGTDAEDLQQLTLELMNTLNSETDLKVFLPDEQSEADNKGVGFETGQIILVAFTSGTVVALFEVLKAYFERKSSMQIELKRKDGEQMKIKAQQVSRDQIDQTIAMGKSFLEESDV